jgi:hypothetical protein
MREDHDLNARIFLRTIKDAQFCLYLHTYKQKMVEQYNADSERVTSTYLEAPKDQKYKLLPQYKGFQLASYVFDKLGIGPGLVAESTFERSMDMLRKLEADLNKFDPAIANIN